MGEIASLLVFIVLPITAVWLYFTFQEKKRQRIIERRRKIELILQYLQIINSANEQFQNLLNLDTGYFSNHQLTIWKEQHSDIYNKINQLDTDFNLIPTEVKYSLYVFLDYFNNGINLRNNFNERFVREELRTYSTFFNNIEGRKLDNQQRTAIVSDEDNNIVIAGAGSGKTTTIVGKVNYVLDRYKIRPEEILLISFTNKSADTLAQRINVDGVDAKTFHKLGKDIIAEVEGRQPSIFDDAQFIPLLTRYFNELAGNTKYLQLVTEYFSNLLKPTKSQFEFSNQGEYIQYMKDQNFKSYKLKEIEVNGRITYRMEVVKSIEECKIANFLLFNGIDYEYEFPYEHDTSSEAHRQYKPDFTITQNGKKVYLEHFGISRNGEVPSWFSGDETRSASEKYKADMEWKRNVHRSNGTTLIESYSFEMSEDILFENLIRNLQNAGIILNPKSEAEKWEIISNSAKDELTSFITLAGTFITLMKSNNLSSNEIIERNNQISNQFIRKRNAHFVELVKPIYERYELHLRNRKEIDFSDMINKATEYVEKGRYSRTTNYIIVDEFQDISFGRYQLMRAIRMGNPACKMFCVGDDWQSIYRFSGSDIALFKNFEKYFGYSIISKIETTYRFHDPLIRLSSDFILKNPNQVKKDLKGISNSRQTGYKIVYSTTDNQDDTFAILKIFHELSLTYENIEKKEIIILGRYGFDVSRIKNEQDALRFNKSDQTMSYRIRTVEGKTTDITAQFLTVHKSKGLEGDIVIVLNCNAGRYGFPSEVSDDPVLNLLLSESDQFENGEERRLFYVAMTRAREMVYFVTDRFNKSKFISEIEMGKGTSTAIKCPKCKTADIVLRKSGTARNGTGYRFYGCTNFLYGCDFTKTDWINNPDT